MTYLVYEDGPTNRIRVHRETCTRCNDGQGMKGRVCPTIDGHGPFGAKWEAIDQALGISLPNASGMLALPVEHGKSSAASVEQCGHEVELRLPSQVRCVHDGAQG